MSVRGVLAPLAMVASGCSLLTPVGDLTAGGDAPAVAEGGADVGSDSGNVDAGNADSGATRFCDRVLPTPALCEDFDGPSPLSRWTFDEQNVSASVAYDKYRSAPASMLDVLTSAPAGTSLRASIDRPLDPVSGGAFAIDDQFDIQVSQLDSSSGALVVVASVVLIQDGANSDVLNIGIKAASPTEYTVQLDELPKVGGTQMPGPSHTAATRLHVGDWVRLGVTYAATPSDGGTGYDVSVALAFDGAPQLTSGHGVPIRSGTPHVAFGVQWASTPIGAWQVRYDDIVVQR